MIAVNVTASLRGELDGRPQTVEACAERWWAVSDATLDVFADELLAVADNVVAGVFTIRGWDRDQKADNKVVFDLAPAQHWQFLVGHPSDVTWSRGQANPVRKVGSVLVGKMRAHQPLLVDGGHGWHLEVDQDGRGATVRAPGRVAVVGLDAAATHLQLHETPTPGESRHE